MTLWLLIILYGGSMTPGVLTYKTEAACRAQLEAYRLQGMMSKMHCLPLAVPRAAKEVES
jgi:hypothetical protein